MTVFLLLFQDNVSAEVSFHMARPATVISQNSTNNSPNTSNLSDKSQQRNPSQTVSNIEVKQSPKPAQPPQETTGIVMNMEWTSLVDTATKAISEVSPGDSAETEAGTGAEVEAEVETGGQAVTMGEKRGEDVESLLERLSALEAQLSQERQDKSSLESEIVHLKEENVRLKEESQTAAQQLRRFTEWFFQTIDKS